uniref:Uncharacterized protein n=1 Tax=Rhizophora mucronata TaxID=61149 RepID=A0A2P2N720_RHIMU
MVFSRLIKLQIQACRFLSHNLKPSNKHSPTAKVKYTHIWISLHLPQSNSFVQVTVN